MTDKARGPEADETAEKEKPKELQIPRVARAMMRRGLAERLAAILCFVLVCLTFLVYLAGGESWLRVVLGAVVLSFSALLFEVFHEARTERRVKREVSLAQNLTGVDLNHLRLSGIYLRKREMESVRFSGAGLRQADLQNAKLIDARFANADLSDANLRQSRCRHASFYEANLEGAKCQGMKAPDASFQEANLRGVDFKGADLSGARFQGADLTGATFVDADVSGCNFSTATVAENAFDDVRKAVDTEWPNEWAAPAQDARSESQRNRGQRLRDWCSGPYVPDFVSWTAVVSALLVCFLSVSAINQVLKTSETDEASTTTADSASDGDGLVDEAVDVRGETATRGLSFEVKAFNAGGVVRVDLPDGTRTIELDTDETRNVPVENPSGAPIKVAIRSDDANGYVTCSIAYDARLRIFRSSDSDEEIVCVYPEPETAGG